MSIIEKYQETLSKAVGYTLTYDLNPQAKKAMFESLTEIGYAVRDFISPKITEEDKVNNRYVYSAIEIAIYLRLKNGKLEPLFMDDDLGVHYLMEEGTNTVAISMKYNELCEELGLPTDSPISTVQVRFNNEMAKAIEETKSSVVKHLGFNVVYIENFLKNSETDYFNQFMSSIPQIFEEQLPHIQETLRKEVITYLKGNRDVPLQFKVEVHKTNFLFNPETEIAEIELGISIANIIENRFKNILTKDFQFKLGKLSLKYAFSQDELKDITERLNESVNNSIRKPDFKIDAFETIMDTNKKEKVMIYYINPEIKKEARIVGDVKETEQLFEKIFEFCKTGDFLTQKQYSKTYKKFFAITKPVNGVFKITANKDSSDSMIEISCSGNGFAITSLGGKVQNYLEKNKVNLDKLTYLKGNPQSPMSLDNMILVLNGLANRIYWEGLLGFYDGRTTLNSATKKSNESRVLTPEDKVRQKYKLPHNVNVLPNAEIVGEFCGVPILKGSTETMVVIFGVNGANTMFVSKDTILNNIKEYEEYGCRLPK